MSAERIKEAARAWLNAACYEAEVREGITGHITRAYEQFGSEVDALAARLSGLQDTLAAKDEALRFYADESNYDEQAPPPGSFDGPVPVPDDRGAVARAALALSADGPGSVPGDAPTEKENA